MKLYWSSRSPFVRKVMLVAHETDLADRIERVRTVVSPTKPNAEVMRLNPLNKLPTLILDDGRVLYDSRVIAEYLDGLHDGQPLFPSDPTQRFDALRRQALADGIMDFLLVGLIEGLRPEAKRSVELLSALQLKFKAALDALEREVEGLAAAPFGIGHIAIAAALGYADFRYAHHNWREQRPRLTEWHRTFATRPSYTATAHANEY